LLKFNRINDMKTKLIDKYYLKIFNRLIEKISVYEVSVKISVPFFICTRINTDVYKYRLTKEISVYEVSVKIGVPLF
jgi:hypothetical protein